MTLNKYPNELPAITLDFQNSRQLDPRITFSRLSAASPDSSAMVNGKVQQFDINVPRLGDNGLMIEAASTNYIHNSIDFSTANGDWTHVTFGTTSTLPVVSTPDQGIAPDGTNTATRLQAYAGDGRSVIDCSRTTGSRKNGSIWMKSNTGANQTVYLQDQWRGDTWPPVKEIVVTPEWKRFYIAQSDWKLGASESGDATIDILIWGAQVEEGRGNSDPSTYTSYIPTSGGEVTRAADLATMPAAYNVNQNTIINNDFGIAGGSDTLTIVGDGKVAKRTAVYNSWLTQEQTDALTGTDDWWKWRIESTSFGLPNAETDGQVTVDWGDGTTFTLVGDNSGNGIPEHAFVADAEGFRTIKFRLDSGNWFQPAIADDATHKLKLISVGPMPVGMSCDFNTFARGCSNLLTFDAAGCSATYSPNFTMAFRDCSSLLSFPYIDASDTTSFYIGWSGCSSLTRFPVLDSSNVTRFESFLSGCSKLKDFPQLDTSKATTVSRIASSCAQIATFPWIDTSGCTGTTTDNWIGCATITSFPLLDFKNTSYNECWKNCSNLTDFPANAFNSTPIIEGKGHGKSWSGAWSSCSLTAQSIENILVSLDANGAQNCEVHIGGGSNASKSTWSTAANTAYDNLITKGWTVNYNP